MRNSRILDYQDYQDEIIDFLKIALKAMLRDTEKFPFDSQQRFAPST